MIDSVFVIAECGSCWRFGDDHLANAYRMIEAAKECGADAVKFQWTSSGSQMAIRRKLFSDSAYDYEWNLQYPPGWLKLFAGVCETAGIEFMCTVFLPQDVEVIAPLVKRFKVAAKEVMYQELFDAFPANSQVVVSRAPYLPHIPCHYPDSLKITQIHCIPKYPTPIDEIKLFTIFNNRPSSFAGFGLTGLSDHTGHVLTGAVAVGAGARVIESHVRLHDTPADNPDFPHSLVMVEGEANPNSYRWFVGGYGEYVQNIRTAERMM